MVPNRRPHSPPATAPPVVWPTLWVVWTWYLPSVSREIEANWSAVMNCASNVSREVDELVCRGELDLLNGLARLLRGILIRISNHN